MLFSNSVPGILFKQSHCRKILFLHAMTCKKKNTHNNEWNSNDQGVDQARPNRAVPMIIQHKNKWAKGNSNYDKNDATNTFPFPSNDKQSKQYKGWNEMDEKGTKLLPDGEPRSKRISGE